ncbi:MAG: DUF456 domain-containing protein [Frankiales bacterium]|nr:DUF456 domain-containing protein [Frankiales bacterium]
MGTVLLALVMLVGLVGVAVPLLPGTALVLAAGVGWALLVQTSGTGRWLVVAAMTVLFAAGIAAKYALPARRLAGRLPRATLVWAAAAAVLGLVLLPPFGLLIGGVAGAYLAEARRLGHGREAVASTGNVLRAIGLGLLAELTAGISMVGVWLLGVVLT